MAFLGGRKGGITRHSSRRTPQAFPLNLPSPPLCPCEDRAVAQVTYCFRSLIDRFTNLDIQYVKIIGEDVKYSILFIVYKYRSCARSNALYAPRLSRQDL